MKDRFKPEYRHRFERDMELKWKLEDEGMKLLDVIAAEFSSDPMSVQCFDLRVVEAVKRVSAQYRDVVKNGVLF